MQPQLVLLSSYFFHENMCNILTTDQREILFISLVLATIRIHGIYSYLVRITDIYSNFTNI